MAKQASKLKEYQITLTDDIHSLDLKVHQGLDAAEAIDKAKSQFKAMFKRLELP